MKFALSILRANDAQSLSIPLQRPLLNVLGPIIGYYEAAEVFLCHKRVILENQVVVIVEKKSKSIDKVDAYWRDNTVVLFILAKLIKQMGAICISSLGFIDQTFIY